MRRTKILLAVTVLAGALAAPAGAVDGEEPRGCAGTFSGPESCVFRLRPTDRGFRVTVDTGPGSPVAAVAECCLLLGPDGEPVRHPVTGETMPYSRAGCLASAGGGRCSATVEAPPGTGVVPLYDDSVTCRVYSPAGDPISGTWSCTPV